MDTSKTYPSFREAMKYLRKQAKVGALPETFWVACDEPTKIYLSHLELTPRLWEKLWKFELINGFYRRSRFIDGRYSVNWWMESKEYWYREDD